jgi:hypothetical protein
MHIFWGLKKVLNPFVNLAKVSNYEWKNRVLTQTIPSERANWESIFFCSKQYKEHGGYN